MNGLKDIHSNEAGAGGILPDALVTAVNVQWIGSEAMAMIQEPSVGKMANELRYPTQNGTGFPRPVAGRPRLFPRRHTCEFRELP